MKKNLKRFFNGCRSFWHIISYVCFIPVLIILLPFIIVLVIIDATTAFKPRKAFKFLEVQGFKASTKGKPRGLKWMSNNICILHQQNSYKISFDYNNTNPTLVNIYESEIGSPEEREGLKSVIVFYENAHPRDKMEGFPDINIPHVQFIKNNLNQIISHKTN